MSRSIEPVPRAELERRWAAADSIMQAHGLDALVMQNAQDWLGGYVRWFTGAPANAGYPRCVIHFGAGDMTIIEQGGRGEVRARDPSSLGAPGVRESRHSPSYVSVAYTARTDAEIAYDVLKGRGAARVGWVSPAGAYFKFGETLTRLMGPAAFRDVTDEIDAVKAVKSPYEQELIGRTARLQDEVLARLRAFIRPGLRDFEVAAYAQYVASTLGAEQGIYINSSGPPGEAAVFRPHAQQGRTLEAGDLFAILVETNGPGGYYTEIARTFSLGPPPAEVVEATRVVVDAQAYTLERLLPGAGCREVADQHDAYMTARGLAPEIRLYCHGQGYDMVERPLIRQDEGMSIAAGMNIALHPGFVTRAVNGLITDNYLVCGDEPPRRLHQTPQDVLVV
ncbi:MAG TPA: M24 family metallopeptidase [Phenylobacterium sp.]|nr:M24 family metallopeptidase [Phenylobacterium sp.]